MKILANSNSTSEYPKTSKQPNKVAFFVALKNFNHEKPTNMAR